MNSNNNFHPSEIVKPMIKSCIPVPPTSLVQLLGSSIDGEVMPAVVLRKIQRKPIFENFNDTHFKIHPPMKAMRSIDELQFHTPTEGERKTLNIYSSKERLYLHNLNDILIVCGACRGYRFDSTEISQLRHAVTQLEKRYNALNTSFESLPQSVLRYRFESTVQRIEDIHNYFDLVRKTPNNHIVTGDANEIEVDNIKSIPPNISSDEHVRWYAWRFQCLVRNYVVAFSHLRNITKQTMDKFNIQIISNHHSLEAIDIANDEVDHKVSEFRAKALQPFPTYLSILMQKYHREERDAVIDWTINSPLPPVDSIAQFAIYLSKTIIQSLPMTVVELQCIGESLLILKVDFTIDYSKLSIEVFTTYKALCQLYYQFFITVRELRLLPREKALLPSKIAFGNVKKQHDQPKCSL